MIDRRLIDRYDRIETGLTRLSSPGSHPGLERVRELFDAIGHPQTFRAIHLAGTNGKGSTAAFLESIYRTGGYRTVLYTSPHLTYLGERLLIDGRPLPPETWEWATNRVAEAIAGDKWLNAHRPTYFENLTAAAYLLTARAEPDVAVIETGMGGRLDATNLLDECRLTVITSIDWDHMEFLGHTLQAIASEKFGIIKRGVPALYAGNHHELIPQFLNHCREWDAPAFVMTDCRVIDVTVSLNGNSFTLATPEGCHRWRSGMIGAYQPENAALALRTTEILADEWPLSSEAREIGLESARWPGRLELVTRNPDLILDGAHNPHGMHGLIESLVELYGQRPLTVVFTAMADKDYFSELTELVGRLNVRLICTHVPHNARCALAEEIATKAASLPFAEPALAIDDPWSALTEARRAGTPVVLCGSLYFIGAMRARVLDEYERRGSDGR